MLPRALLLALILLMGSCAPLEVHWLPIMEPNSKEEIYYNAWKLKEENEHLRLQGRIQ